MDGELTSFDDIEIGVTHRAGPYLVTAEEAAAFTAKWDPWDYHLDHQEAEASLYGGLAASGVHTLCICNLLAHQTGQGWDIRAQLSSEYRLLAPTRVGEELWLTRTATNKRRSKSRPEFGIVECLFELANHDDVVVLEQRTTALIALGDS
jgi:acyl dehydratase